MPWYCLVTLFPAPPPPIALCPVLHRLVVRALDTWRHLATSASTPSTIILAPSLGGHRVPGVEGGQPANTAEQVRKLSRGNEGKDMYGQQDRQGSVLPALKSCCRTWCLFGKHMYICGAVCLAGKLVVLMKTAELCLGMAPC